MPGGASLKVIKLTGGSWENTARTLVPVSGTTSNLFPSYSPDGSYVAYANGKGGHGDPTMNLYLVAADGSSTPIQLSNANHAINNDPTLSTKAYENNAPTWAPSGDYEWIAFNSFRPYGVVSPAGAHQQIWVAAIDKSKLGTGQDPSFPAFRFAFQYLVEDNHRAFWAEDVRAPPPADDGGPVEGPGGACLADGADLQPDHRLVLQRRRWLAPGLRHQRRRDRHGLPGAGRSSSSYRPRHLTARRSGEVSRSRPARPRAGAGPASGEASPARGPLSRRLARGRSGG